MKSPVPRVAAVHDLSGVGRCSLTAVTPILSRYGIQVCPLPTALLSTQTAGYENYFFQDLTGSMEKILDHWKQEKIEFDAIYTGFLGSAQQARVVARFIEEFRRPGQLVVVDPVMGDGGEFYGPYTNDLIGTMKELTAGADLITPNFTEAAFLLGEEYRDSIDTEEIRSWCRRLSERGPERVIITSVPLAEKGPERISLAALDRIKDDFFISSNKKVGSDYPGTGDIFTSLVIAFLIKGTCFKRAVKKSERKIQLVIRKTCEYNLPKREGVLLEKYL